MSAFRAQSGLLVDGVEMLAATRKREGIEQPARR
jgi:hypothetical protein